MIGLLKIWKIRNSYVVFYQFTEKGCVGYLCLIARYSKYIYFALKN